MRTMVLEYESQHLPGQNVQFYVGKYTSTMVRIWVMNHLESRTIYNHLLFNHPYNVVPPNVMSWFNVVYNPI